VDKLQCKAPQTATVATVPTPSAKIADVEHKRPPKNSWAHMKQDSRKHHCSDRGDQGSLGDAKKKPRP